MMINEGSLKLEKMTAGIALAKCLVKEEVEKVFCVPGESFLPVLDALYDVPEIEVISARHEGGAAFMAEGYAKASNKPGVVFATRGVGASNLAIGIHTAHQDSTPLVVFLGQVDSKFRGREAFQEIDFDQYFHSISKWTVEVRDPERIPEIVQRGFRIAKSGRPGPVVISLPEDILYQEAPMQFGKMSTRPKPAPSLGEIKSIENVLQYAKKPLIIAGGGILLSDAEKELISFAEKYHIPVMAAFCRHSVFPNDHHLYLGHIGFSTNQKILEAINEADTILALGTRLSEATTQSYSLISAEKKLIHIDIDYDVLGQVYPPDIGVISDIREACKKLLHLELDVSWEEWVNLKRTTYEKVSALKVEQYDYINKHVIKTLQEELPNNATITVDAGNFAGWLHSYFKFDQNKRFFGSTNGAMGYGLPAAIGAKLAFPERTVVSFSGDGGFMMTAQEIETSIRYHIPIISLVFNNNMYGTIRAHQEHHFPNRVIATDLGNVSFSDLAKSLGAEGFIVETADEFSTALKSALKQNKSTVIEVLNSKEQISVSKTINELRMKN